MAGYRSRYATSRSTMMAAAPRQTRPRLPRRKLLLRADIATGYIGYPRRRHRRLQSTRHRGRGSAPVTGWLGPHRGGRADRAWQRGRLKIISLLGAFRGKQPGGVGAGMPSARRPSSICAISRSRASLSSARSGLRSAARARERRRILVRQFQGRVDRAPVLRAVAHGQAWTPGHKVYLDGDDPRSSTTCPCTTSSCADSPSYPCNGPRTDFAARSALGPQRAQRNGAEIETRGAMLGYFNSELGGTDAHAVGAQCWLTS